MNGEKYLSKMLLLGFVVAADSAAAAEIYHWVDDDGVAHFSDTPPGNGGDAQSLHVNSTTPSDYDPAEDPYSIVNQAKRINEKLSDIEEGKRQRAEERREMAQNTPRYYAPRYDGWRYSYWPGYYAPVRPIRPSPDQLRTVRRQVNTLDALELSGPRPYSINSGAHATRVENSSNFLQSVTAPRKY